MVVDHDDVAIAAPRSLPRGPHRLPREVVILSQRRRLLDGIVAAVAEKGYAPTTVADVIRNARVSRTTFYEQFADKEDCFLAAYDDGGRTHYQLVAEAVDQAVDLVDQVRLGVRAYLDALAAYPAFARAFLLEVFAAGPKAARKRAEHQARYIALLRRSYERARADDPGLPELSHAVFQAAATAVDSLVTTCLWEERPDDIPALEPTALYVLLSVLGLPHHARAALGGDGHAVGHLSSEAERIGRQHAQNSPG